MRQAEAVFVVEAIRRRQLKIWPAGLMLQQYAAEGHEACRFIDKKEQGVALCFFPGDVFYRAVPERAVEAS